MTTLDIIGLTRPGTVLKVRRTLKKLKQGEELTVLTDDQSCVQDLPTFCQNTGHHLLMANEQKGIFTFQIRKGLD